MHHSAPQLWAPLWQSQISRDYRTRFPIKPTRNQMSSPDYLDKNKQVLFCTTNLGSLPPLFTRKWRTEKKQIASPGNVQGTLQTEHTLKKSPDIVTFLTVVLPISTRQEEAYCKNIEKGSQAKPWSHISHLPSAKWTEHPTVGRHAMCYSKTELL